MTARLSSVVGPRVTEGPEESWRVVFMDLEKEPWENTAGHLVPTCVCVCQLDTLSDGQQEHVFRSVTLGRFQIPGAGGTAGP